MNDQKVVTTLGEVACEPVEQFRPTPSAEFTYVDISSIDRESKVVSDARLIAADQAPSRAKQVLRSGDVLVSMTRPNLNAVALVPDCLDGAVGSTGFHVLRSKWMAPRFLYYLVQSSEFVEAMSQVVQGALYPAVRPADITKFQFRLPPHREQTRIVEKLEELLSDLDAGVAELKAAQKKLALYRQSLLKAAVEGALTADWRARRAARDEALETGADLLARILTERRARWETRQLGKFKEQGKTPPKGWEAKYPEPVQPDTAELPMLPVGWVWASAEQLCDFITKGTTPPKDIDQGDEKDIPFLRVTNLTENGTLDFSDRVFVSEPVHRGFLGRSVVYPGDVLMNIVGPPLGQVSVVTDMFSEWNINQAIAIFRAVQGISPRFLCSYLLSPVARKWLKQRAKTTAGQTNLTLEVCRRLPVPLPPQDEQEQLSEAIADALSGTDQQAEAGRKGLEQAAAQRKNLLKAAFSGQLVSQDPNDEPASAVLARIRAEREGRASSDPARRKRRSAHA